MEPGDIVQALMDALDQRRAPEGMTVADLMRLEHHLTECLRIVRALIEAVVRGTSSGL